MKVPEEETETDREREKREEKFQRVVEGGRSSNVHICRWTLKSGY